MRRWCGVLAALLLALTTVRAQERPEFVISRANQAPKIDGVLDDEAWSGAPLALGDWLSYNPLYGQAMQNATEVHVAYDDRYIYFGFHCLDTAPSRIRTTLSRRDNSFNDDWIGLSLDASGNGQTAYHLFSNPSGIQMDALNTPASGEKFEADFVWDSAGRIVADGYIVEIRVPLQTIRFSGGPEVKMGILFWRHSSASGLSWAWPDIPPGLWVFNRHAHLVFRDLEQPRLFEVIPSITYNINQTRNDPNRWDEAIGKADVGLSAKYGITGSITLDATVNPDFSQVESDAFQVQTNQRFPIFFSEKRPFFMEGIGLFNVAGSGGDGNMRTAVHTRHIVNPSWGTKLTGNISRWTLGALASSDETPEEGGGHKLFNIGRLTYGLGEADYAGILITDTEHEGRHNRVFAGDISLRPTRTQQFSTTVMSSQTGTDLTGTRATAAQAYYNYRTRTVNFSSQIEHYGRDFQMDTAFYNRTGFTEDWSYLELNFYPGRANSWIKRIAPFTWDKYGRDQVQDGNERTSVTGIQINFTRQGFFRIDHREGHEPWLSRQFKWGRDVYVQGQVQILQWLHLNGNLQSGNQTYYDPVNPFQGRITERNFGFTLQPNLHINEDVNYNGVAFDRASNGERVFTVHIVNLRSTYQFDRHFLVRAIEQFDSSKHRLLTDLLAAYEFVPGTVVQAGYGSLFEKRDFANYATVSRGLFFKVSYLHRF
jgi:uncharacterized protein DUF5916/cellulose/xylan binding protein with CBM9 domain